MNRVLMFVILILLAPVVRAQTDDMAAERARLANQRIEAEARAREEQERQARLAAEREQAAASQQAAPSTAVESRGVAADAPASQAAPVGSAPREATRAPVDIDRMLEQIQTLGELRDAGYVTDSEFERIKRRILDSTL